MCGIVGFYGHETEVVDTLIAGLKRLEYRGYDSAGIALVNSAGALDFTKSQGKVAELESKVLSKNIKSKNTGIAHTRWATHGEPSEVNAHPHTSYDFKIAVVHNGIIENYKVLKSNLEAEGVVFLSKTDTEVIGHLIAKFYRGDIKQAVLEAITMLEGAFAFAVIHQDEPGRIIAAKKGSPLVLGIGSALESGGSEIIIASDVSAIINKTKNVIYLEDEELVDIESGDFHIHDFKNNKLRKPVVAVDWNDEQATKEGWDHFLIKEIMEQPSSVVETIRGRTDLDNGNVVFGGLLDVKERIQSINKVILLGIGTSYYAAKLGEMYFEHIVGITAKAEMSPEFKYKSNCIDENTWVIAISQSGETADTISGILEAKQKGALVTGIVNSVGSTIARITDAGVYNHIGPEISVASTKAFTSQTLLLLMHAVYLARFKDMSLADGQEFIREIQNLPNLIKESLKNSYHIKEIAKKYHKATSFFYLGRKFNYPIALEGTMKLKEINYSCHAEGLSGGELKHGFIAQIDETKPTLALVPSDSIYSKMCSNVEEVIARKGKVIAVLTDPMSDLIPQVAEHIIVPKTNELLQPIVNNIALQLFAYHCSNLSGFDVDKPRNLAKSVTVE
jgi:glutamine---fructose-6-phosphate transaminase (isomerizing)